MRCAIITIQDSSNYGNRLQNYASQSILKKMGHEADTLLYKTNWIEKYKYVFHKITNFKFAKCPEYWRYKYCRIRRFMCFNRRYIDTFHINSLEKINSKYDKICIGSDQVWNSTWFDRDNINRRLFLLPFADASKRVCIAPSIGADYIEDEWKTFFSDEWKKFPHITVREQKGCEIVKELAGKDAVQVIDPTLMLSAEEWNKISKKPKKFDTNCNYAVAFFLGEVSTERADKIRSIVSEHNFKLITLNDKNNKDIYSLDPSEFLYLINNAKIVFTDSFHGTVFSFLYNKPFIVFEREDDETKMNSRLDTLLSTFCLENRFEKNLQMTDLLNCDYDGAFEILLEKRKEFYKNLKKQLEYEEQKNE